MTPKKDRTLWICGGLALLTVLLYSPLLSHDFISYDDGIYLTDNPHVNSGLSWENVKWAFTTGYGGNWHPLTWISHGLDVLMFGMKPGWHHLVSLLIHAANGVLLFLLLQRITRHVWRSAFVAALFAVHPLHVESVAWAAERKDVLSGFFFMLTLLAYARSVQCSVSRIQFSEGGRTKGRRVVFYVLAVVMFALGLMSKPMLVTLPFVLLLLDYWPLGRLEVSGSGLPPGGEIDKGGDIANLHLVTCNLQHSPLPRLLLEKVPFLLLTIGSCIATLAAQKGANAVVALGTLTYFDRVENAIVACALYIGKMFWPLHLGLLYPLRANIPLLAVLVALLVLIGITALVIRRLKSQPYLAIGWFWYLGMLVPVIGLVQVGMQQMADRYSYLPLIGIFIMIAWGVPDSLGWCVGRRGQTDLLGFAAVVVLAGCCVLTVRQLGYWQNSETIFARTIEVTRDNYVAYNNHGDALLKQGKVADAMRDFETAIALHPELDAARLGLGEAFMQQGQLELAAEQFSKVLETQPDNPAARLQLGVLRGRQGKLPEAEKIFTEILRAHPDDVAAHNNLGNVMNLQGRYDEAAQHFAEAVRLQPQHASAHNNLGMAFKNLRRNQEAIAEYRAALQLNPGLIEAMNNLAWIEATSADAQYRNGNEALALAGKACEMTKFQNPVALATYAAANAETGHYPEAISIAEGTLELLSHSQGPLIPKLQQMVSVFRAGQPFRE